MITDLEPFVSLCRADCSGVPTMRALGLVTTEPSAAQLMELQDSIVTPIDSSITPETSRTAPSRHTA